MSNELGACLESSIRALPSQQDCPSKWICLFLQGTPFGVVIKEPEGPTICWRPPFQPTPKLVSWTIPWPLPLKWTGLGLSEPGKGSGPW